MKIFNLLGYTLNKRENAALLAIISEFSESFKTKIDSRVVLTDNNLYWAGDRDELVIHSKAIHDKAREMDFQKSPSELRALFYPAASMDDLALKHALLYFDKVCLITPDEIGAHSPIGKKDELYPDILALDYDRPVRNILRTIDCRKLVHRIDRFNKDTWDLRRDGILYFLSPSRNVTPQLYQAILRDIASSNFVSTVNASDIGPFYIGISKAFHMQSTFTSLSDLHTAQFIQILCSQLDNTLHGRDGIIKVPPEFGASILLTHTVLACHEYGLTPFTDAQLYQELLLEKFRRAANSKAIDQYKTQLQLSATIMAKQVMNMHLPQLSLRTFDDVLEAREKLSDELLRFRAELMKFATQVKATPYDEAYQREIERIVAGEINPAIEDLKAKLKGVKRSVVSRVIKGVKSGTVPIAATLLVGMPLPYVLALSAGFITIEALWDAFSARRDVTDQNGLSFLLRVS